MKKAIDFLKIKKSAKRKGISPYLEIKRILNYKKGGNYKNCFSCQFFQHVKWTDKEEDQCAFIGISRDKFANINDEHICDNYS